MRSALRIVVTSTAVAAVGGLAPGTAPANSDSVPCDPATGCLPSTPSVSPSVDPPMPTAAPTAIPAPAGEPPSAVRRLTVTVKNNDSDSVQGFSLGLRWAGGTTASSFLVRLEKVAFKALSAGDTAKKPSQFMQIKPGDWIDTKTSQPKRWKLTVPKATAFYRVQVRGQNQWGSGPMVEQYFLVAKDNEKTIVFKSGV